MKYRIVLIVGLILLPLICPAQEISFPFSSCTMMLGWEARRSHRNKGKRKKSRLHPKGTK